VLLLLLGLFFLSSACQRSIVEGAISEPTYYVSQKGDDNNSGSLSQPFKSIEKAREVVRKINSSMQSNVVVYLRGGDYLLDDTLVFDQRDSGTNGFYIVYKAYPGEKPVVSGGQRITGWVSGGEGIYKAQVGSLRFRQLYVNGKRATRARDPNAGNYYRLKYWDEVNRRVEIIATHTGAWDRLNEVEMVVQKHWNQNNLRIASYTITAKWYDVLVRWGLPENSLSPATRLILTAWIFRLQKLFGIDLGVRAFIVPAEPERSRSFTQTAPQRGNDQAYHFENALEFLDAPGEWYLNTASGELFYKPRVDEDMGSVNAVVPRLQTLIELKGDLDTPVRNMQFFGLIFEYSNWLSPNEEGFVGDQAVVTFTRPQATKDERNYYLGDRLPGAIYFEATENIRFERNIIMHIGSSAVVLAFGTRETEILGNVITDVSGSGIVVEQHLEGNPADPRMISRNDRVANNYVSKTAQDYYGNVGIFSGYTSGLAIEHNEVTDMPYTGISVGWGWSLKDSGLNNNVIRRNHIYRVMQKLDDGGGIYTLSKQPGTRVSENHIHDVRRSKWAGTWPVAGIYLDQGSDFIFVENNVVRDVERKIHMNLTSQPPAGSNNVIRDNENYSAEVVGNAGLQAEYRSIRPVEYGQSETKPRNFLTGAMVFLLIIFSMGVLMYLVFRIRRRG
jgi:hypothetical protein